VEPCCRICLLQRHSGSQLLHRCQIGEDSEDEVDITTDSENEVDDTTGVENDVDVPTALMTSSTLAHVTSPSLAVGGHYHSFVGQGPCSTITFHQLDAVLLKHLPKGCWLPHHVVHRLNHACSVWFLGASPGVKATSKSEEMLRAIRSVPGNSWFTLDCLGTPHSALGPALCA